MKKLVSLFFVLIFAYNIHAQITISDYDGLDLTNTTAFLPSGQAYHFQVTNNGSSEITFIVEVMEFSVPDDATGIAVCGGGTCVQVFSAPVTIGSPVTLAAGDTYGEEGNPDGEVTDVSYTPGGSTGAAYITIRVYEEGNESNSAEFTLDTEFTYILGISLKSYNVYPNPAYQSFSVKLSEELVGSRIIFTNVLGKVVFTDVLNNGNSVYSTDRFKKGMYFYTILKDGKSVGTKKLIIK
jgi:hypothetical protein